MNETKWTPQCSSHFLARIEIRPQYNSQIGLTSVHLTEDSTVEVLGSVAQTTGSAQTEGAPQSATGLSAGK